MTYFLLDIGNSRIKWASTTGNGKLSNVGGANYSGKNAQAFAQQYWDLAEPPDAVMISCVASLKFGDQVSTWIEQTWGITPKIVVSPAQGWGVHNAYLDPSKLGADRWAALVAARQRTQRPCCVVDCGTALTVDILAADGAHQGGLIVPGLTLMRESLFKGTARVKAPQGSKNTSQATSILAHDTFGAVNGGTLYSLVAFVDRVVSDVEQEVGHKIERILTGGDGPAVLSLLAGHYDHVPELVLEGLAVMAAGP